MMTRSGNIACDDCGRFIKLQDLVDGYARHSLATPGSDLTKETWESQCKRCVTAEKATANPDHLKHARAL